MGGLRYFGGAVAFGFAAMWIMASLAAALVCLMSAVVGYGVLFVAERTQAKLAVRAGSPRRAPEEDLPIWADALNSDLGHVYEPASTTSPLAREVEYGWALIEDTVVTSETLQ